MKNIFASLGSLIAIAAILTGACSQGGTNTAEQNERLCTPGAYVFCLCQDGESGTKLCHDDGQAFDDCELPGSIACPGGNAVEGGVTEGGPAPGIDGGSAVLACPGKAIAVEPGKDGTASGDTTGASDSASGKAGPCAVGTSSPDNVYQIIPTVQGALKITAKGSADFDPTIYLRSSCKDQASEIACSEGQGGTETITTNVRTTGTYFLYVDGKTGSAGAYSLDVSLTPASFCGDGTVDTGEACDDGNNTDNDGCSPDCKSINGDTTTPVAKGAACPGEPVHVWGGATKVTGTGTTTTYPNTFKDTDSGCKKITNVNNAPDHVYAVTVHKSGTLTVSTQNATFNCELLARTVCADATTTTAAMCANDNDTATAPFDETMSFAVTSGSTYYVAVDGANAASKGDYTIVLSLP